MANKLYLIPNSLTEDEKIVTLPAYVGDSLAHLRVFAVEEETSARRLLKKLQPRMPFEQCVFFLLNEHTPAKDVERFFNESSGKDVGMIAEAGCPCVADPGSDLVRLAHRKGWEVIPLVGPSSILLGPRRRHLTI